MGLDVVAILMGLSGVLLGAAGVMRARALEARVRRLEDAGDSAEGGAVRAP